MPFGLTNSLATLQAIMNEVFALILRKYVLIFFYHILVYTRTLEEHAGHFEEVLGIQRANRLFAKRTKCFFGQRQVDYLGYVITD